MALNPELIEVLACPKCKGPVTEDEAAGLLICPSCKLGYEVREGIPVMLVEEAKALA